jgi:hypothetical protein
MPVSYDNMVELLAMIKTSVRSGENHSEDGPRLDEDLMVCLNPSY